MDRKKVLPVFLVASITGETLLSVRHSDTLAPQPHTEVEIAVPLASTVSPGSASGGTGGGRMKLKIGKPMASPVQRRDTGRWLADGSITIHNDSECVSVDVMLRAGEFDSKEEAVRSVFEKANRDFAMHWLNNGGVSQLHRATA